MVTSLGGSQLGVFNASFFSCIFSAAVILELVIDNIISLYVCFFFFFFFFFLFGALGHPLLRIGWSVGVNVSSGRIFFPVELSGDDWTVEDIFGISR